MFWSYGKRAEVEIVLVWKQYPEDLHEIIPTQLS